MCDCKNGHGSSGVALAPCEQGGVGLERTRFFPRQLVGPDDLTQDQTYFLHKLRRHNRLLHGWGVVCGLCVRRSAPNTIVVEPGVALSPWGDEIVVDRDVTLDLRRMNLDDAMGCCEGETLDPWCQDTRPSCTEGTRYLAVRYRECESRPVRSTANACGCGCDEEACEYSRVRDSYAFKLLSELPQGYTDPMRQPPLADLLPCARGEDGRMCPPCPDHPWVVIADVRVTGTCEVGWVQCHPHRRYVVSFADAFLVCRDRPGIGVHGVRTEWAGTVRDAQARAVMTGADTLVDLRMAASGEAPRATVTLTRPDGRPVSVPAYFAAQPDDTLATLLDREGDREFYDPAAGTTHSLREIFTASDADPKAPVHGTLGALSLLEGRTLDLAAHHAARTELAALVGVDGLELVDRQHLGRLDRAVTLSGDHLLRVDPESDLGKGLARLSIAEIREMDRDAFVKRLASHVPPEARAEVRERLAETWQLARRVGDLTIR